MMDFRETVLLLDEADSDLRRQAVKLLPEYDLPETPSLLVRMLFDGVRGVQEAAAESLQRMGGTRVIENLLPLLRSENIWVRNTAISLLKELAPSGVDMIATLLRDKDDDVRIFAATVLSEMDHDGPGGTRSAMAEKIAGYLTGILKDPNPNIRSIAVAGLGNLQHRDSVDAIVELLKREDAIQFEIILALGCLRDLRAADALLEIAKGDDVILRYAAVDALAQMHDEKVLSVLIDMLRGCHDDEMCGSLIRAIVDIARSINREDLLALENVLTAEKIMRAAQASDPFIRRNAVYLVRTIQAPEMIPVIAGLLLDLDQATQQEAIAALIALGNRYPEELTGHAVEVLGDANAVLCSFWVEIFQNVKRRLPLLKLIAVLEEANPLAVAAVLRILQMHPDKRAEAPVLKLATHADADIRLAAIHTLEKVGGGRSAPALFRVLRSDTEEIKEAACGSLYAISVRQPEVRYEIVRELNLLLDDADETVRMLAVNFFGTMLNDQIRDILLEKSNDSSAPVRDEALKALGLLYASCREIILLGLVDEDADVRKRALTYMVQRQNPQVLEKLVALVRSDPDLYVRYEAVKALGDMKTKRAHDELVGLYGQVKDRLVKVGIIEAFAEGANIMVLRQLEYEETDRELKGLIGRSLQDIDPGSAA